jgi:ubiquinone biosynthesis protein COQ9
MVMGQAQFNPYWNNMSMSANNYRAPVYRADPIHGENAAWAFPIGGGEIYLPDADQDIIWWIKVDQNGNKQVIPFDVMPHKKTEPVDMDNILSRLNALEERVNGK